MGLHVIGKQLQLTVAGTDTTLVLSSLLLRRGGAKLQLMKWIYFYIFSNLEFSLHTNFSFLSVSRNSISLSTELALRILLLFLFFALLYYVVSTIGTIPFQLGRQRFFPLFFRSQLGSFSSAIVSSGSLAFTTKLNARISLHGNSRWKTLNFTLPCHANFSPFLCYFQALFFVIF